MRKFIALLTICLGLAAPGVATAQSSSKLPPRALAQADGAAIYIEQNWGPAPLNVTAPSRCPKGRPGWNCRFRVPRSLGVPKTCVIPVAVKRHSYRVDDVALLACGFKPY